MYSKKDIHFLIERYIENPDSDSLKFINDGCSRDVFFLDEKHVIKISKNTLSEHIDRGYKSDGIAQTLREMKVDSSVPFEYKYLFNPIVDKGIYAGYLYVVQDYVRVAGDRWSDSSYEEVCYEINYTQEEIEERLDDIKDICAMFKLEEGDILNYCANLGIRQDNEQLVIIDYGFPANF